MFIAKRRGAQKRHAMGGSYDLHKEIHIMSPLHAEIVRSLVVDFDLPLGIIAKYKPDHPVVKGIDPATLEATTANNTLFMLINAGALQDEITKLTMAAGLPILGSSANLSGTGAKFQFEDVNREILDVADITLDYGLIKFVHSPRTSSAMLDFSGPNVEVVRIGVGYEIIRDHIKRFWNIDLPADPGKEKCPSGHLKLPPPPLKKLERLMAQL
ncbi:hypothetical protein B7463_g10649, partial [Scytalidium lignicola]